MAGHTTAHGKSASARLYDRRVVKFYGGDGRSLLRDRSRSDAGQGPSDDLIVGFHCRDIVKSAEEIRSASDCPDNRKKADNCKNSHACSPSRVDYMSFNFVATLSSCDAVWKSKNRGIGETKLIERSGADLERPGFRAPKVTSDTLSSDAAPTRI
jgi:hypothetical protein